MAHVSDDIARKNARMAIVCGCVIVGMFGVAYAAVPLYRWFCQVTGFGGTPMVEDAAPGAMGDPAAPTVTVRFNADINRELPWRFEPVQTKLTVPFGEQGLALYEATNTSDRPIIGTATFNVTPLKAAQYFAKIQCFCFTEQRLDPGETMRMPVTFFVDPALLEDERVEEVRTITLSYTFFEDHEASREAGLTPADQGDIPTRSNRRPPASTDQKS